MQADYRSATEALNCEAVRVEFPYRPLPDDGAGVVYLLGPDSLPRAGIEPGATHEFELSDSQVYPGTHRRFWVHVPAVYDPASPAHVAIFQDGWWYLDPDGAVHAAVVIDNLVARGEIPVTIGVFVDPGELPGREDPKNRNQEYDAADERYARLLIEEILPVVASRWSIDPTPSAALLCGGSSGGNCSFTAAWHRPDRFGHVTCFLSSFAQIPCGNPYPALITASAPKPIKVFLQAAHRDIGWNQPDRNWLAENLHVAAALATSGYEFRLVLGDGGHSPNHAGALLPDTLRWHWSQPT